jgi:hypothetical protein
MRTIATMVMGGLLGGLAAVAGGPVAPAEAQSVWLHARVDTQGSPGQQVSRFRAFATSDQAGLNPVAVPTICVKGIAHRTDERCAQNASEVILEERRVGLPGVGALCVEAQATAVASVGPLTANARACP